MKIDAATRTVDRAEARERKKAHKALAKWLPLRRAALALSSEPRRVGADGDDAETVEMLLEAWRRVVDAAEPEVEVASEEKPA